MSINEPVKKTSPCKSCGKKRMKVERVDTPPRPSCLACVEKHLGAAMVLLSEMHHGYEYRLRFIGHLHGAQEESQQWPQLHGMIRSARKAYQRDGIIPDWESLAQEVAQSTL